MTYTDEDYNYVMCNPAEHFVLNLPVHNILVLFM